MNHREVSLFRSQFFRREAEVPAGEPSGEADVFVAVWADGVDVVTCDNGLHTFTPMLKVPAPKL